MARIEFEVVEGWEKLPEGWSFVEVAGVATDSKDRVYAFNRGEHPMIVFDAKATSSTPGERAFSPTPTASTSVRTTGSTRRTTSTTRCASSRPAASSCRRSARRTNRRIPVSCRAGRVFSLAADRSTASPTSRCRPPARCTSPTATATPVCTSSPPTASTSSLGANRPGTGRVPAAPRHRRGPRRHGLRCRPRELRIQVFKGQRRLRQGVDPHRPTGRPLYRR